MQSFHVDRLYPRNDLTHAWITSTHLHDTDLGCVNAMMWCGPGLYPRNDLIYIWIISTQWSDTGSLHPCSVSSMADVARQYGGACIFAMMWCRTCLYSVAALGCKIFCNPSFLHITFDSFFLIQEFFSFTGQRENNEAERVKRCFLMVENYLRYFRLSIRKWQSNMSIKSHLIQSGSLYSRNFQNQLEFRAIL